LAHPRSKVAHRTALVALFTIYFFDCVGMVIALSLFGPLIAGSEDDMVAADTTAAARNLIVGFLIAAYSFAQFFAAPVLGELSDRYGRRPVLLFTTLVSALSFALCGLAINLHSLPLLFVGRFLGGAAGGNMSAAQAGVADISPPRLRGRYISYFAIIGGPSWVIGPFLGGLLSDRGLVSWFNMSIPFWLVGFVFLIAFVLTWAAFSDIIVPTREPLYVGAVFKRLVTATNKPPLRDAFWSSVLALIGWAFFLLFLSPYLVDRFQFNVRWVSRAYLYAAVWYTVGGILAGHLLLHRWLAGSVNIPFLILQATAVLCFPFFSVSSFIWWGLAIGSLAEAIVGSAQWTLLSRLAGPADQGRVFGSWAAFGMALSGIIAPSVAGWLAGYWIELPFLVGVAIMGLGTIYYCIWYARRGREAERAAMAPPKETGGLLG
jgi:MFS transporter, DHA1 family, tetracycline resistance protein